MTFVAARVAKSLEQGAATSVWCAVSPRLDGKGGVYCEDCDIAAVVPEDSKFPSGVRQWAIDKPTARAFWDLSEQITVPISGGRRTEELKPLRMFVRPKCRSSGGPT